MTARWEVDESEYSLAVIDKHLLPHDLGHDVCRWKTDPGDPLYPEYLARARLIVTAVKHHAELVEVLAGTVEELRRAPLPPSRAGRLEKRLALCARVDALLARIREEG